MDARAQPVSPWRRAWLTGLGTWAIAFVSYLMLNAVFYTMATRNPPPLAEFFNVWSRWDTGHYLYIATNGYNPASENPAFFPLYPLLMRIFDPILPGQMLAAGLIISSVACIIALAVIHRLVEDLFDTEIGQRTAMYLMASPMAFILVAVYNESLFLALAVGSLYCMRRGHWWWAGVLAGFSSAARQAGLLLALAFVIEYLRRRDWQWSRVRPDALAILLVPTGLIGFMIYDARVLGDPLKFAHVQEFWGRKLSMPWTGIGGVVHQLDVLMSSPGATPLHPSFVVNLIDLLTVPVVIALLVLSLVGRWRLGQQSWYLIAFGSAVFFMVLVAPIGRGLPPLRGVTRYALEVLPIFMVLAKMGADRRFDRAYLFLAVALQAALLIGFFASVWLA